MKFYNPEIFKNFFSVFECIYQSILQVIENKVAIFSWINLKLPFITSFFKILYLF